MLKLLRDLFIVLDEDKVMTLVQRCLKNNYKNYEIVGALNEGLEIIGKKFEEGEYTLSDLMMAGIMYEQVLNIKEFNLYENVENTQTSGTILVGTVESDMHDIGKSLFKSAACTSGFRVIDLGVNVSPQLFYEKVQEYKPQILGISAVLSTTVEHLKKTIMMIDETHLRKALHLKIIIGGNMVDEEVMQYVNADAFTNNAAKGVDICKKWVSLS